MNKAIATGAAPDFTLLRAILYYLREFPQRRHHRNEDQVLFARIKARTHEADEDWHKIHTAFESHEDPIFGEDTAEEFRSLLSRIIRLARPPNGTGESQD